MMNVQQRNYSRYIIFGELMKGTHFADRLRLITTHLIIYVILLYFLGVSFTLIIYSNIHHLL